MVQWEELQWTEFSSEISCLEALLLLGSGWLHSWEIWIRKKWANSWVKSWSFWFRAFSNQEQVSYHTYPSQSTFDNITHERVSALYVREPILDFFAHVSCEDKIIAWQSRVYDFERQGRFLQALVSALLQKSLPWILCRKRRFSRNFYCLDNFLSCWSGYSCYFRPKRTVRADTVSVKYFLCFSKRHSWHLPSILPDCYSTLWPQTARYERNGDVIFDLELYFCCFTIFLCIFAWHLISECSNTRKSW